MIIESGVSLLSTRKSKIITNHEFTLSFPYLTVGGSDLNRLHSILFCYICFVKQIIKNAEHSEREGGVAPSTPPQDLLLVGMHVKESRIYLANARKESRKRKQATTSARPTTPVT